MAEANRFLKEEYLPQHNLRFVSEAEEKGSAFVPFIGDKLKDVLSVQEERTVGNDNTVRYKNLVLQIPQDKHRYHYVRAKVRVHEYPGGGLAVFHGPRRLADYTPQGEIISGKMKECVA